MRVGITAGADLGGSSIVQKFPFLPSERCVYSSEQWRVGVVFPKNPPPHVVAFFENSRSTTVQSVVKKVGWTCTLGGSSQPIKGATLAVNEDHFGP
jgi:hypothetical protein